MKIVISLILFAFAAFTNLCGAALNCDLSEYRRQSDLEARVEKDALIVEWRGESNAQLRAEFVIEGGIPTVRELAVRNQARDWTMLGRNLKPVFSVTTGIRRTNHGLPEEKRWDVFWDVPLNHTNEVRSFAALYHAERCELRTDGASLEISFP